MVSKIVQTLTVILYCCALASCSLLETAEKDAEVITLKAIDKVVEDEIKELEDDED